MILLLTIRNIENKKYRTNEYVNLNVYFFNKFKNINTPAIVYIIREVYIIEGFKINILTGVNLFTVKDFVLNLVKKIIIIGSYKGFIIEITVIPRVNERV